MGQYIALLYPDKSMVKGSVNIMSSKIVAVVAILVRSDQINFLDS